MAKLKFNEQIPASHDDVLGEPNGTFAPPLPPPPACLQLLLATLLKLSNHPELSSANRIARATIAGAVWPQLFALQLAQSTLDPRALAATAAAPVAVEVQQQQLALIPLVHAINELRALALDQAEWGLLEALVIGGKGISDQTVKCTLYSGLWSTCSLVKVANCLLAIYLLHYIYPCLFLPDLVSTRPQQRLRELSHLALARYHLVAHPRNAHRLTRILLAVNALQAATGNQDIMLRLFFRGDAAVVLLFINNMLLLR